MRVQNGGRDMLVNVQITKHISLAEVVCHCRQCNEQNYNLAFLRRIDKFIRDEFEDAPIIIDRVCSCAAHNAFIGGAEHSRHLSYTPKDNSAQEQAKALQAFAIDIGAIQGYTIEQARVI